MATRIAENVSIDPHAQIDDDVEIGPFCVIGPKARIGQGSRLENNVTLMGDVTIGQRNHVFPGVVIGGEPQDLSYRGSNTRVVIGDDNVIRECVTINRASEKEDGVTRLGSHNFLMGCCHVAHDCQLGDHIVIANGTLLGGHVHMHDHAWLSGGVGIHHFATIGSYAFVAGMSAVRHDVPPYMLVEGYPAKPRCINAVGLKRNNFPPHVIQSLSEAHRLLYRAKVGLDNAWEILRNNGQLVPQVNHLLELRARSARGPARPRPGTPASRVRGQSLDLELSTSVTELASPSHLRQSHSTTMPANRSDHAPSYRRHRCRPLGRLPCPKTGRHGQRGTRGRGRSAGRQPRSAGRRTAHGLVLLPPRRCWAASMRR